MFCLYTVDMPGMYWLVCRLNYSTCCNFILYGN